MKHTLILLLKKAGVNIQKNILYFFKPNLLQ